MAATATPEAALGSAEAEAAAPETGRSEAATQSAVTLVKGEATVLRADESSESLDAGAAVGLGDVFKTGSETVLGMNLAGHIEVAMGANSVLAVEILPGRTSSSYPATQ
jgi:hypothetical protein